MPFTYLRPIDYARILIGWLAVFFLRDIPANAVPLAVIIAVIVFSAFGVVKHAERLARILGDPYGSLVLTLSIVIIEVVLIAAVMLGPGESPTIARDSVMAVSLIILALVAGLCIVLGGLKFNNLHNNGTGTQTYLILIAVLTATTFAVPLFVGSNGTYTTGQAVLVALGTFALYIFFLWRQIGAQAGDFREATIHCDTHVSRGRFEVFSRSAVLIITVLPIVVLSHTMAAAMDSVLSDWGAPAALAGLVIATIVFLPETMTALRAAWGGEVQRVSNLVYGALVSTVGLTIPSVLMIGVITNRAVVLGETPENLLLLGLAVVVSIVIFSSKTINAIHGMALLLIFGVYMMALFS